MTFRIQRNYKNGLFLMIFGNKPALLRFSDSFIKQDGEEAGLECTATMININFGHNPHLMEACRELYEYSYLIEEIRIGSRSGLTLPQAIERAANT